MNDIRNMRHTLLYPYDLYKYGDTRSEGTSRRFSRNEVRDRNGEGDRDRDRDNREKNRRRGSMTEGSAGQSGFYNVCVAHWLNEPTN